MDKKRDENKKTEKLSTQTKDLLGENSEIASKLRQFYTSIQEEEIPERFLDLLDRIDEAEKNAKKKH